MPQKIAFVYFPYAPDRARLETMPLALNSVKMLADEGWFVDVYLWEQSFLPYKDLFSKNVTIINCRKSLSGTRYWINKLWRKITFQWHKKGYSCVFGVGQIGNHIANRMARSIKCPLIYINDELPSEWPHTTWLQSEREAAQNAAIIIVPDPLRFRPLCQELGINDTKPYAFLPTVPIVPPALKDVNWHEQLGLPSGSIPFLQAGSLADWTQVPEILSSVPYWPEKAILLLHARSRENIEAYRKQLSHLDIPGKVVWSSHPLPESRLNSLVSYCAGNFALYRNTGPNIEYIGLAAGKLMRSIACGSPVIASEFQSLSFVTEHRLGHLIKHPIEIPAALEDIIKNRPAYAKRCLQFCQLHVSFEKQWKKFCEQLKHVANIDLSHSITKLAD